MPGSVISPLPHCGRGRGLSRSAGQGEGDNGGETLTRLALLATLSRNAGEGFIRGIGLTAP